MLQRWQDDVAPHLRVPWHLLTIISAEGCCGQTGTQLLV